MKPWKLVVDWTCQVAYGDKVEVILDVMDRPEYTVRTFLTVTQALDWARVYMHDRGCRPVIVNEPGPEARRVVLHARPHSATIDIDC